MPNNCLRHSFTSYLMAKTQNAPEVSNALLANGELLESEAATLEDGYRLAAVIEAIEQSARDGNQCTVKFGSE